MASYSIQMLDPDKNVVYPHALAKATLLSNGSDVESALTEKANLAGAKFTGQVYAQNTNDKAQRVRNIEIADALPSTVTNGLVIIIPE